MDHIGIDVHKRESQIYILAEGGEIIERRIRTEPERFGAVLGTRPHARIVIEASTDSEWVARCLEALGHEVIVADPNVTPMFCDAHPQGEDRPARCPGPRGGVPARGLPPGPSALRSPAARARPPGGLSQVRWVVGGHERPRESGPIAGRSGGSGCSP